MDELLATAFEGELADWVGALPEYQATTITQMLTTRGPVEVSMAWLGSTGPANTEPLGAIRTASNAFYDSLLSQMHTLLCSKTQRTSEHAELVRNAKAGRTALITGVATIIAPHLGASPMLIAPAVALTLALMAQAGKDSACAALKQLIEDRKPKE